jgi:predicted nucleic acid-binding protein
MSKPKSIYLDACVFLSYLREDQGRHAVIDACLTRATKGEDIRFFTSTISIVELAHLSEQHEEIDPKDFEVIAKFWANAPVTKVDVSGIIAEGARKTMQHRLITHRGQQLPQVRKRMHDLCHVSTAEYLKVDEIWTYDPDFKRYNSLSIPVMEPYESQLSML